MSGIYIHGMEMPKNCCGCPLGDASDGWYCKLTGRTYNWGNPNRASWCPLIAVPEHGRLGDLDAMAKYEMAGYVRAHEKGGCGEAEWLVDTIAHSKAQKLIKDTPTIIPAELVSDTYKLEEQT